MAWLSPLRRCDENRRSCWGYIFQLTPEHLTPEQMHPLKFSYDRQGEEALKRLDIISPPSNVQTSRKEPHNTEDTSEKQSDHLTKNLKNEKRATGSTRDLYALLRDNASSDDVLSRLWSEANTIPSWVDWEKVARGQDVFYRYGGPCFTGLAYQSLLGGLVRDYTPSMSNIELTDNRERAPIEWSKSWQEQSVPTHIFSVANPEIDSIQGGFSTKVARHRLFETTQLILQVTQSLQSIQPGGAGHASALRVRLLHAAVRRRILKLAQTRPDYYNVSEYGIPINDLDCIATIGTFSATLIWLSLPRQGIYVTEREASDYVHLWRYVAYIMGTPTEYFETRENAKRIMEVLLLYEVNPSETSRVLANNVIKCLTAQPPSYASKSFLEVNARWLNGNELCDGLGLGRPGVYYWCLMGGQCLFFMGLCYTYRLVPWLDKRKIKALRKIFWAVIIESKGGLGAETTFDFKYIPELSKRTQMEDLDASALQPSGVERRNLQVFGIGCVFLGICGYIGLRVTNSMVKALWGLIS